MDCDLRRIGQGFCGSVWAAPLHSKCSFAHKREDGGPGRSLHNDFLMHGKVYKALSSYQSQVSVPGCHKFVYANNQSWWDKQITRFPAQHQVPCNILITDRITPFPKVTRDAITDLYCPESLRSSIKSSVPDEDCLIRPYLGRRRLLAKQSRFQAFSLRNYPLHVDQVEEIELDSVLYVKLMAEALAVLYWSAKVDVNDVEFVLAPPKKDTISSTEADATNPTTIQSHILGNHAVWILDFDCCKEISLDESGVEQAVVAFYRNDPFYPRPNRDDVKDQRLWEEFKNRFLEVSGAILGRGTSGSHLPQLWVDQVEQRNQA